jgi:hypothetical protein
MLPTGRAHKPGPDATGPGAGGQLGHVPWRPHDARGPQGHPADRQLGRGQVDAVRRHAPGVRRPAALQRGRGAALGRCVEDKRTTFTYMRGKVGDKAVGEGSASAFQRPGATWSAVALTFDNAAGTKVTVSALFDLPKNGTESSVGRYYLIDNSPLDLAAIEDIAEKRFTKGCAGKHLPGRPGLRRAQGVRGALPPAARASTRTRRCPCSASSRPERASAAA